MRIITLTACASLAACVTSPTDDSPVENATDAEDTASECPQGHTDDVDDTGESDEPHEPAQLVVFLTSHGYRGDFGGGDQTPHEFADGKCRDQAIAYELEGTFRAWISTSTIDAVDHVTGEGPWYTTNGQLAFPNRTALTVDAQADLRWGAGGQQVNTANTWTGTSRNGTALDNCLDWTDGTDWELGRQGSPSEYQGGRWTSDRWGYCDDTNPFMCFQVE